jgi:CRISPR-associated protein Cas5h
MKPDKAIIFDVWGRYAHFKKIYVTTSALSYGVPFKTSIYGLIGAILGLDNRQNDYLNPFNEGNCKIGIQVINPIRLQRLNINLSDSLGPIGDNRKPTMMEFVKNPNYRIFFSHSDHELFDRLLKKTESKTSVYTPVLGLAHCIANFRLIGLGDLVKSEGDAVINSVLLKSQLISFDQTHWIENDVHIQEQDMYPLEMNAKREVIKRDSILFDINGKSIKAKVKEYYSTSIKNEITNIMLM